MGMKSTYFSEHCAMQAIRVTCGSAGVIHTCAPASASHRTIALCGAPHERSRAASTGLHARQLMRHCVANLHTGLCTLHCTRASSIICIARP